MQFSSVLFLTSSPLTQNKKCSRGENRFPHGKSYSPFRPIHPILHYSPVGVGGAWEPTVQLDQTAPRNRNSCQKLPHHKRTELHHHPWIIGSCTNFILTNGIGFPFVPSSSSRLIILCDGMFQEETTLSEN